MSILSAQQILAMCRRIGDPSRIPSPDSTPVSSPAHLARGLVYLSVTGAPKTIDALRTLADDEMPEENKGKLALEELIFCLSMIGRWAFTEATVNKRELFMDELVAGVGEVLWRSYGEGTTSSQFLEYFFDQYNARSEEYARYRKAIPEKKESSRDTLLWEYGKRIAALVSPNGYRNALMVTSAGALIMRHLERLMPLVQEVVEEDES